MTPHDSPPPRTLEQIRNELDQQIHAAAEARQHTLEQREQRRHPHAATLPRRTLRFAPLALAGLVILVALGYALSSWRHYFPAPIPDVDSTTLLEATAMETSMPSELHLPLPPPVPSAAAPAPPAIPATP